MTCNTLVRGEGELASLLQPLPVDEVVARGVGHHHVHLHKQEMVSQVWFNNKDCYASVSNNHC